MPEVISAQVVMLVEGNDEKLFLEAFFSGMQINGVAVIDVKGKDNFRKAFAAFVLTPGFVNVRALAVVRDADYDANAAMQSVRDMLTEHRQPAPAGNKLFARNDERKVGVFIMPGSADSGMLEDLCMATVENDPAMPCVREAFECIKSKLTPKPEGEPENLSLPYLPRNLKKCLALLFLATRYKPISSVGWAARNGVWNLAHPCFDDFRNFIRELVGPDQSSL